MSIQSLTPTTSGGRTGGRAGVYVTRQPSGFSMTRTPAGVTTQIRAARYGASGLAAPQSMSGVTMPGVGYQAPPAFDFARNPATLRAVARGATAQGYAVRQMLRRQEEARWEEESLPLRTEFGVAKQALALKTGKLLSTGRPEDIKEATRLNLQFARLRRLMLGE